MAADSYDLTIDQGADWLWSIRWKVGRTKKAAVPKDVTGYEAVLVVAATYNASEYLLELSTDNGGATVSGEQGLFTFQATSEQTEELPTGKKLKYEVRTTSTNQTIKVLARGVVNVNARV